MFASGPLILTFAWMVCINGMRMLESDHYGTVILIVRDRDEAAAIRTDDDKRELRVFTASEVARLIEHMPTLIEIKRIWPGATIKPTRFETPNYF